MRTTIKIVGIGERRKGVSKKNNKNYDFQPLSFLYDDKYTTGYAAATANVDGPMLDAVGGVNLNEEREVFYHTYNNTIIIDGIL